jgi:hypothetical protein
MGIMNAGIAPLPGSPDRPDLPSVPADDALADRLADSGSRIFAQTKKQSLIESLNHTQPSRTMI